MPDSPEDILRRIPVAGSVIAGAERIGRQIEGHERLPIPLYIAELFLFLIIAVYFMQLAVLGMGITSDYGDVVISVATYIIDVIMIIATVDAVLGISSKKPSSWRCSPGIRIGHRTRDAQSAVRHRGVHPDRGDHDAEVRQEILCSSDARDAVRRTLARFRPVHPALPSQGI